MNAGTLTEIIEIWKKQSVRDEFGEKSYVYAPFKQIRANVVHNNGSRTTENDEIWHDYSKTFKVRLHTPVEDEDKIKYQGHFYIVQSVETDLHLQTIIIQTERINEFV